MKALPATSLFKLAILLSFFASLILIPSQALGAIGTNKQINFQGKVVNASGGTNVTDGTYDFVIKVYEEGPGDVTAAYTESWTAAALWSSTMSTAPISGGTSLVYVTDTNESTIKVGQIITNTTKEESVYVSAINTTTNTITISATRQAWATTDTVTNKIYVNDGIFRIAINSLNQDFSGVDFTEDDLYVGVTVGSDSEMKPRMRLTASPYTFQSEYSGTTGTANSITADSLTSGKALSLASAATAFTGSLQSITLSGSNVANTGTLLELANTGTANANTSLYIKHYATGTNNLAFRVDDESGDTSPFVIDGGGNVGIGTTGPGQKLEIAGNAFLNGTRPELQLVTGGNTAKARIAQYGALTLHMTSNLSNDGTNWNLDDTANAGTVISSSNTIPFQLRYASAGTNPRTLSEFMRVDTTGNVGIGTTAPSAVLHAVTGANGANAVSDPIGSFALVAPTNANGILAVASNDSMAADKGGSIAFGTRLTASSANNHTIGLIGAYKTNATTSNGDAYMAFQVRIDGTGLTERMRINKDGNVGIGATNPSSKLDVTTAGLGVTQTTSSGLALVNTTAAAAGAQQISPAIRWSGFGWKTDATAASQATDMRSFLVPVQGTANPSSYLTFESSINGGVYGSSIIALTSGGNVGVGTTAPGAKFQVVGVTGDASQSLGDFRATSTTGSITSALSFVLNPTVPEILIRTAGAGGSPKLSLAADTSTPAITILTSGNVGIGTTTPGANLAVVGTGSFSSTLTANTFSSSGVTITGGSINGTTIGASTPSTGAFTTLTSSGNTTLGTGASGAHTYSTGAGSATTLGNSTGALTIASGGTSAWTNTSGGLTIQTATSGTLALDSAGALNIGNTNATSLSLGRTGVTTTNNGSLTSTQTLTASNGLTLTTGALSVTGTSGSIALTGFGTTSITSTTATGNINTLANDSLTTGTNLALTSTATALSSGGLLSLSKTGASGSTAYTGDIANITYSQTFNGGVGLDSTGNVLDISRAITLNNTGNTHTISGALASFSDSGTQTAGTLTSTADVLRIAQNYTANSGAALNITSAGAATAFALRVNDDGTFTDSTPFVIDNGGNVGIGTTAPLSPFDVSFAEGSTTITGAAAARIKNTNTTSGNASWLLFDLTRTTPGRFTAGAVGAIGTADAATGHLAFYTNNAGTLSEKVRILNDGNVGIGTTAPNTLLELRNATATTQELMRVNAPTSAGSYSYLTIASSNAPTADRAVLGFLNQSVSANAGAFLSAGSSAGPTSGIFVKADGNVGIGTTSPTLGVLQVEKNQNGTTGLTIRNTDTGGSSAAQLQIIDSTISSSGSLFKVTNDLGLLINNSENSFIQLMTNNTNVMRLTAGGNVGIGTTNPSSKLDVTTAGLGVTQTTSSGLALVNTTAAAAGAQQISPAIRWSGFGWKTDVTAASQAVDFRAFVTPVQAAAAPTGYLGFGSSINGGAYSDNQLVLTSGGNIGIGVTSPGQKLSVSGSLSVFGGTEMSYTPTTTDIVASHTSANSRMLVAQSTAAYGGLIWNYNATAASGFLGIGTNGNNHMNINQSGSIGIGTTSVGRKVEIIASGGTRDTALEVTDQVGLYVVGNPSSSGRPIAVIHRNSANTGASEKLMSFWTGTAAAEIGSITENNGVVSYNAFTGSHVGYTAEKLETGMLVSMTGENSYVNPNKFGEPIYGITKTSKENDPSVIGTYNSPFEVKGKNNTHLIYAAGNGEMWVVDNGSNIKAGDYLISSSTPGHAIKDPENHPVSHVIAKASEDVDWSKVGTYINGTKRKKISVLYGFFAKNNSNAYQLDAEGNLVVPSVKADRIVVNDELRIMNAGVLKVDGTALVAGLSSVGTPVSDDSGQSQNDTNYIEVASKLESIDSQVAGIATQSAALAQQVASQSAQIAELSQQLSALSSQSSESSQSGDLTTGQPIADNFLNLTPPEELFATGSATLATLEVASEATFSGKLNAYDGIFSGTLKALGESFLGNTTIAGTLAVDGTTSISGNSINSLGCSEQLGTTLTSRNSGGSDSLSSSEFSENCGILYIQNSPLANLVDFFNGAVTIAKDGLLSVKTLEIGSESIGSSSVPAGTTQIFIPNSLVKDVSKIFVTVTSDIDGNVIVAEKISGSGFSVKLTKPNTNPVTFDWWLVQAKEENK